MCRYEREFQPPHRAPGYGAGGNEATEKHIHQIYKLFEFFKFLSSTLTDGCLTNWNANFSPVNEVPYQIV